MTDDMIYRLMLPEIWADFKDQAVFTGTEVDTQDGFIHFSSASQLRGTAAKHYGGHAALVLVAVAVETLGDALKWEVSRGGALFPHLYAALDWDDIHQYWRLPSDGQGGYLWPDTLS